MNLQKCIFDTREVGFLGYIVSLKSIYIEPSYISVIRDWPVPISVKDIQVFLGFTKFY